MTVEPTKPIAERETMAVETTSVTSQTKENAAQADEAPASEEGAAAQLGDFA